MRTEGDPYKWSAEIKRGSGPGGEQQGPVVKRHSSSLGQGSPTPRPAGCTAGGEWWGSEQSFICGSPSLALRPEPSPTPPLVRGETVFHRTGPWCQKGWGPLLRASENTSMSVTPSAYVSRPPPLSHLLNTQFCSGHSLL